MTNVISNFSTNLDAGDYLEKQSFGDYKNKKKQSESFVASTMNIIKRSNIYGSRSLRIIKMEPR